MVPGPDIEIGFCGIRSPWAVAIYRWRRACIPECVWSALTSWWQPFFFILAILIVLLQIVSFYRNSLIYGFISPSSQFFHHFVVVYVNIYIIPTAFVIVVFVTVCLRSVDSVVMGADFLILCVFFHAFVEFLAFRHYRPIPEYTLDKSRWHDEGLDRFHGEFDLEVTEGPFPTGYPEHYKLQCITLTIEFVIMLLNWMNASYLSVYRHI
uniref:MARVEL domain-containing protein n=1 Tax=Panagrellus redivivus TaxID=6233 RepID=A0A7E4ZQ33_PANRE